MNYLTTLFASVDYSRTSQLLGRRSYLNAIALIIILVLTGWMFYLLGGLVDPTITDIRLFLGLVLLLTGLTGVWTALKATSFQRTLLLQTTSPVTIYWFRTLQSLILILPVSLVTLVMFVIGYRITQGQTWDMMSLSAFSTLLLPTTLCLFMAAMTFLIRRISRNYFIRSILLIALMAALTIGTTTYQGLNETLISYLLYGNLGQLFIILTACLATLAFSVCLLELVFTNMPVALKALPRYWQIFTSRSVVNNYDGPLSMINREILHYLRDAAFQRRLLSYFLVLATFVGLGTLLDANVSIGRVDILAFGLAISLTALSVSYRSGSRAKKYQQTVAALPVKESAIVWSFWTASLIVMALMTVAMLGVVGSITTINLSGMFLSMAVIGLLAHLISYYLGLRHHQTADNHGLTDLTALIAVVVIAIVPTIFYGTVSAGLTLSVLVLWLLVIVLYLRLKVVKNS